MARGDRRRGFTMIEVMIVIALIAIIVAIAIYSLSRARISGNETRVIALLRAFCSASESYRAEFGRYPDPDDLFETVPPYLPDPGNPDIPVTCGFGPAEVPNYSGYMVAFNFDDELPSTGFSGEGYEYFMWPTSPGKTGERVFYADESGVVRAGNLPSDTCELIDSSDETMEDTFRAMSPID